MHFTSAAPRSMQAQALHALRLDAAREALATAIVLTLVVGAVVALGWMAHAFAFKALAVFASGCALLLWGLAQHMPHRRFGAANRVTLLRLAMIAFLAGGIGEALERPDAIAWTAVVLATVAALLDALDGPLARAQGLASAFGARFDMESDAFLVMVLSLLVWHGGKAGAWVLLAGLARYLFVAAAWAWPWLRRPLFASLRRKTVCVVQITCLIVCLGPIIARPWSQAIAAASLGLLLASFAIDVRWLWQQRHAPFPTKETP